jgi:hypothetical protein
MNYFNKNNKNLIIFLGVLLSIFLVTIIWKSLPDNLKLVKYFIYVLLPLFVFLYLKKKLLNENIFIFSKFKKNKYNIKTKEKNLFSYPLFFIFLTFIISEFVSLDLPMSKIDTQHEGNYLSSFQNYISTGELWKKSHFPHGLSNLMYPYLGWKIFGFQTIGSFRLFFSLVVFILKILSVILVYQITKVSYLDRNQKHFFFIILSTIVLSLSSYEVPLNYSPLSIRYIFILLFLLFFLNIFIYSYIKFLNKFNHIMVVFISLTAFLLHLDIGLYLIFLIFLYSLYLFFIGKYENLITIIFSSFSFVSFIIFFFGHEEIFYFFKTTYFVAINIETIHGTNYPEPFFSIYSDKHGMRATKGLLSQIVSGIFVLNLLTSKKTTYDNKYKIFFFFLYVLCFFSYFNALGRADSYHIKMSTGLSIIINTIFILNYLIDKFNFFHFSKKNFFPNEKIAYLIILLFLFLKVLYNFDNKKYKIYISLEDHIFINTITLKFVNYFSQMSKEDVCFLNFTDDIILNYLLKKPSCTRYYNPIFANTEYLQNDYINQFAASDPVYILYKSNQFVIDIFPSQKLKFVNEYIISKYKFFEKIDGYEIYKKK